MTGATISNTGRFGEAGGRTIRRYRLLLQCVAALVIFSAPVWLYFLFFAAPGMRTPTEWGLSLLLIFIAFVGVALVTREDRFLRTVMVVGLLCKLAACSAFLYLAFYVYNASADALHYATVGQYLAVRFVSTGEWTMLHPVWSTNFIYMVTGGLFIVTGPSLLVAMIVFSLVAFWGQYLAYRAFCIASPAPPGDRSLAAMLLFLLPSIVFWSSSIGKDALAAFFIGLICYGYASLTRTSKATYYIHLLGGLAGILLVRPHVALMLGIALICPYVLSKNSQGIRGVVIRVVGFPLILVATVYLAMFAQQFLAMDNYSKTSNVIERVNANNKTGGSAFGDGGSASERMMAAPFLFFRPFPWEVHNAQSALASVEGMLLLFVCYRNRRHMLAAARSWRVSPFTVFITVFLAEFVIIFSAAISNFGLLARERIMATPLLVMLMCVPVKQQTTRDLRQRDLTGQTQRRPEDLVVAPAMRRIQN